MCSACCQLVKIIRFNYGDVALSVSGRAMACKKLSLILLRSHTWTTNHIYGIGVKGLDSIIIIYRTPA